MIKAKTKLPRPADVGHAKGYVDRVKALIEQQQALGADITDVCAEAKETAALEPSMIRFAARELLMDEDKRNERDEKRHQYLHAVGLAADLVSNGDVSLREAAKACGVSKSSVHRALAVPELSQDWTDFEYVPVREMTADDLGDPLLVTNPFRARVKAIASSVKGQEVGAGDPRPKGTPVDSRTPDEIIGEMPAYLRRVRA